METIHLIYNPTTHSWSFSQWLVLDGEGKTLCSAGAPQSDSATRLRTGLGWQVILLCVLRFKLGAGPGARLIGGHDASPVEIDLANKAATQLYQTGDQAVKWCVLLFGNGPAATLRWKKLVSFPNPQTQEFKQSGILRVPLAETCWPAERILITDGDQELRPTEISQLEKQLAEHLCIPPWTPAPSDTSRKFIGREQDLKELDAFLTGSSPLLQIVSPGGRGKTFLVRHWLRSLPARHHLETFEWSFYLQAHDARHHQSLWPFRKAFERFLGIPGREDRSAGEVCRAWLAALRDKRRVIFLDGMEVLLASPDGRLDYEEMKILFAGLDSSSPCRVIVTSRLPVRIPDVVIPKLQLPPMTATEIAAILESRGVNATGTSLKKAVDFTEGSPLMAQLLASLAVQTDAASPHLGLARILEFMTAKYRFRDLLYPHDAAATAAGKMLARYEAMLQGSHELALITLCSAFQHDPDPAALRATLEAHFIGAAAAPKLPAPAGSLAVWEKAAARLIELSLASGTGLDLTFHPVVQTHFADHTKRTNPDLWCAIHYFLYCHYRDSVLEHQPSDMDSLQRLLTAVIHGCWARRATEAYREVAFSRFSRGFDLFPLLSLGSVHEMLAGQQEILRAVTEDVTESYDIPGVCASYIATGLALMATTDYDRAERYFIQGQKAGYQAALAGQDTDLIGIVLFTLVHRLRIIMRKGTFISEGMPVLSRLGWLGTRKKKLLEAAPDQNSDYPDSAINYPTSQICSFLLSIGKVKKASKLYASLLEKSAPHFPPGRILLPHTSARPHGEFLIATGQARALLAAIERGEAHSEMFIHELGNAVSYLHGLALLLCAFQTQDCDERHHLATRAKPHLDLAVTQAADRNQRYREIKARLARAEWAIAARDELLAKADIAFCRNFATPRGWKPSLIRCDLTEARLLHALGKPREAEKLRKSARQLAFFCHYQHPTVTPYFGTGGSIHLRQTAELEF